MKEFVVPPLSENEIERVVDVVGEGYREGLAPLPEMLMPRAIVSQAGGVCCAHNLLAADHEEAVFEACADPVGEVVLDFGMEIAKPFEKVERKDVLSAHQQQDAIVSA